eukprot:s1836_g17.t2
MPQQSLRLLNPQGFFASATLEKCTTASQKSSFPQGSEAPFAEFGFAGLAEAPQTLAQVGPEAASGSDKHSIQFHEGGTQGVVSTGSYDTACLPVLHEAT